MDATFQDMVSKQVAGGHDMAPPPEELIATAWPRACGAQPPTPDLLVPADRGGQYCGTAFRNRFHDYRAVHSQRRRGDRHDTAQAKSR